MLWDIQYMRPEVKGYKVALKLKNLNRKIRGKYDTRIMCVIWPSNLP